MKPSKKNHQAVGGDKRVSARRPYETPAIESFHEEEILAILGPAQTGSPGEMPGSPENPM